MKMRFGRFVSIGSWLMIFGIIGSISCSKDDEPAPPPESEMEVNGGTYKLENAYLMNYGDQCNGCTDFDIWLTTGFEPVDTTFIGSQGQLVLLDLNSSSSTEVTEGTYTWSISRIPSTKTCSPP